MTSKLEEAQAPADRARAVLIYDGTCGRCPWMDERTCLQAMQLILPDGRVLAGDAAIPEILRRLRGWRWLVQAFRLPGMELLAPRLYAWVARHRYQISCMLGRPRG